MSAGLEAVVHSALYDNETASGWYGEPECAEVAALVTPAVTAWLTERLASDEVREAVSMAINPVATHPLDRKWADQEATAALTAVTEALREGSS